MKINIAPICIYLIFCFVMFVSCSGQDRTENDLPDYIALDQLPANYSIEDAERDRCVVFQDLSLLAGESEWSKFLQMVQEGKESVVRIADFYGKSADGEDDRSFYISDLSFDGSVYFIECKGEKKKQYKYLNHYEEPLKNTEFSMCDHYILTNEKDVSYQKLRQAFTSSHMGDAIDCYSVYTNFVRKQEA